MAKDESEEKTLPASNKKLRDGRKKGQVSKSRDLVSGAVLLAMVIYLMFTWQVINDRTKDLMELVAQSSTLNDQPFMDQAMRAISMAISIIIQVVAPMVAIIVFVTIVTGMIATMGPVFSFEQVKPNFDHINPSKGLERVFAVRNVVEFMKSLMKVAILIGIFWVLLAGWINPVFQIPACGDTCTAPFLVTMLKLLGGTVALAFIIIGIFDVGIQYQLFLRDMKMTRTEYKREQKDIEGDPLIRSQRRSLRRSAAREGAAGIERASFAVTGDDNTVIGLSFGKGAPVPTIVAKASGEAGAGLLEKAKNRAMPIVHNPELAAGLLAKGRVRQYIDAEHYDQAIRILIDLKMI
jgi:type III secretion protein U